MKRKPKPKLIEDNNPSTLKDEHNSVSQNFFDGEILELRNMASGKAHKPSHLAFLRSPPESVEPQRRDQPSRAAGSQPSSCETNTSECHDKQVWTNKLHIGEQMNLVINVSTQSTLYVSPDSTDLPLVSGDDCQFLCTDDSAPAENQCLVADSTFRIG